MNSYSFRFLKSGPTNWGYVLILIIVTILVGGGILSYARYVFEEITALSRLPEIEIRERIKDETATWKTYRNEWYRFEMKYPKDWEIEEREGFWAYDIDTYVFIVSLYRMPEEGLHPEKCINISAVENKKSLSFENLYLERYFERLKDLKPEKIFTINGRPFYQFRIPETMQVVTIFFSGKYIFEVENCAYLPLENDFLEIYNQMLSTFRFLE